MSVFDCLWLVYRNNGLYGTDTVLMLYFVTLLNWPLISGNFSVDSF